MENPLRHRSGNLVPGQARFLEIVEVFDPVFVMASVRADDGQIVDFRYDYVNPAALKLLGEPAPSVIGHRLLELYPSRLESGLFDSYCRVVQTGEPIHNELPWFDERNVRGVFEVTVIRFGDGYLEWGRDVTLRKRAGEAYAATEERLLAMLDDSPDATVLFGSDLRIEFVDRQVAEQIGVPAELCIGKTPNEIAPSPEVAELWSAQIRKAIELGRPVVFASEVDTDKGHRWYESSLVPELAPDGSVAHVVATSVDVTHHHVAEEALTLLATHDVLTGLAGRQALRDELTRALSAGRRSGRSTAVLMVDLDRFKRMNDSYGHAAGDDVLRAAASRISASVRSSDLVARVGGDEFVVVMRDLDDPAEAALSARRVVGELRAPFSVGDAEQRITASFGIAVSYGSSDADAMLRDADAAMYLAKGEGGDRISMFDEGMRTAVGSRCAIRDALRHALERDELAVWYQPEIDLRTGAIIAVEALLRWHHPDGELYAADRFIDVAEESGLILDIGDWVLNGACAQAAIWAETCVALPMTVRVNLSALQVGQHGMLDAVDQALESSRFDASRLCIEIAESTLLRDTPTARRNLRGVGDRGIRIAVDAFGAGYTSLAYLRDFPIDFLEIDRSFISGITTDDRDRKLVGGIVALARQLGIEPVAQGVEHAPQAALLRRLGCKAAQGFLYSEAVPPAEIDRLRARKFLHP